MNITSKTTFPALLLKWKFVIVPLVIIALSILSGYLLPTGVDWRLTYRPVSFMVIQGISPYSSDLPMPFLNAPWVLLPIIPLGLLPENLGRGAFFILSVIGYSIFAVRLGANRFTLPLFLISPPVLHCLLNANLDWIPLLGYILPPQIGLFFLFIKPQLGIGGMIFWFIFSWKKGGFRETLRVFMPVTVALLISFLIYGLWPLGFLQAFQYNKNASLWPLSIPIGLVLMVQAIRYQSVRFSIAASPFFSPYLLFHSWSGAMGAVLKDTPLSLAVFFGLWVVIVIQAFF